MKNMRLLLGFVLWQCLNQGHVSWVKSGGCSSSVCSESLTVSVIQSHREKYTEKALHVPEVCCALQPDLAGPQVASSSIRWIFTAWVWFTWFTWFTLNRYDKQIIRKALQFVRCLVRTAFLQLLLLLGLTGWFALAWENQIIFYLHWGLRRITLICSFT